MPLNLKVKKLTVAAKIPTRAHSTDLGFDLYLPTNDSLTIEPGETKIAWTGIAVQFPEGWGAFNKGRSSQGKAGVDIYGGVIDNGYRGEIGVTIHNSDKTEPIHYSGGDKVGQLVPVLVFPADVEEVWEFVGITDRGVSGFGSTGR